MPALSEGKAKVEIGYGGKHTRNGTIRADEFIHDLKGRRAIDKFREMRDNDATIGAIMYAVEQVLRDVPFDVVPADDSEAAQREAEFVTEVLGDMEHTLDDHISEALSCLTFGFAYFEVVYKRRMGMATANPKKRSMYNDGRMGIRKLASRSQWTIEKFIVDQKTGDCYGVQQTKSYNLDTTFIPKTKALHYTTTAINNDPSGRSILRNAYTSYQYLTNLQAIEAIAVERELHGVPIGRMPSDYLAADADENKVALKNQFIQALRDLKMNEQAYLLIPSDLLLDAEGKATGGVGSRLMDVELMTSNGSRNIEIDPIIRRYQHDIARSVMAEFLMLGSNATGSYALSKSKTDLFLRSVESYINSLFDVLNKQLIEPLWEINGLDFALMPKLKAGDVAPHDLAQLGSYLRNLNGANINLADQVDIVDALLENAELPLLDREQYEESKEFNRQVALKPEPDSPQSSDKGQEKNNE